MSSTSFIFRTGVDRRSLFKAEAVAEGLKINLFLLILPQIIGKILEVLHFIMLLKLVICMNSLLKSSIFCSLF